MEYFKEFIEAPRARKESLYFLGQLYNFNYQDKQVEEIIVSNSQKLLTETQIKKLKRSYSPGDDPKGGSKVLMYRLGIVGFTKWQISFDSALVENKDILKNTLLGYEVSNKRFRTLKEAKEYVNDLSRNNYIISNVYKVFKSDKEEAKILYLKTKVNKIGTMKSMPAKQPKSYFVHPVYLFFTLGAL